MICTTTPAMAQACDPNYPVCLLVDAHWGDYLDCSYTSVAQCSQTVALSPLLEPRLQIEISQGMSRTPSALGASRSHKAPAAVIGRSRWNSRKIIGEITRGLRAERSDRTPGVIGG